MTQLESIGKMIKAKRDERIERAVNKILSEVKEITPDLTKRIADAIAKEFDRHPLEIR